MGHTQINLDMANDTPLEMANELVEKHFDIYQHTGLAVEHALLTLDYLLLGKFNSMERYFHYEVKKLLENPLTEYKL
jgi:hypothetical protein